MKRNHFKVDLSLSFGKNVELMKEAKKIVEGADDFSEGCKYKKIMTIYSLENNIISFTLALNGKDSYEKITLRFITDFLKRICSIFNVMYDSRKKYFSIENCLVLSHEEYMSFFGEATLFTASILHGDSETRKDLEELSEEVSEDEDITASSDNTNNISDPDIKIPKRSFPVLLSGNAKREGVEYPTLRDTLEQLYNLVGLEAVKKQIKEITSFIIRNNERCVKLNIENPGLYFNATISGGKGSGKSKIAKILFHIYYHLGVLGKGKFITFDGKDFYPGNDLGREIGTAQSGVVLIDNAHLISTTDEGRKKDSAATLDEWFTQYKNNFVFILSGEKAGIQELLKKDKIRNHMNFFIDIPDFSDEDTVKLMKYFADCEKYVIDKAAEEIITEQISLLKDKKLFENAYTARVILERAIIKNGADSRSNVLFKENFIAEALKAEEIENNITKTNQKSPFDELEAMIGLQQVKEKVKEISAYASAQLQRKKLGLPSAPLCLHMCFTGNPGTGKTSVARTIGKILNKIGVLSTGKFVEAAREDLVGRYVGHTAVKTSEKIKEAEGGVLFIDEAYSLYSESRVDFGYEAVTTIVRQMENIRDNIVIIFAGYPKEMSRFIDMNPGLKDRIQFKLNFSDYRPKELIDIWQKFFKEEQYVIEEAALEEMKKIANSLYVNRDLNFSNGRIMRKCFERVMMHQSVRLLNNSLNEYGDIVKITLEDITRLHKDKDIADLLEGAEPKKYIGFGR